MKITLILTLSVALAFAFLAPAIAADNSYSIRIGCVIPAVPGQNVPIVQEQKITPIEKNADAPMMLQKDTQEIRTIKENKLLLDVRTLYSR